MKICCGGDAQVMVEGMELHEVGVLTFHSGLG